MGGMVPLSPISCLLIGGACFRIYYCFVVIATVNVIFILVAGSGR